jgi:transcriptional regulator with XRE-family HTH domain
MTPEELGTIIRRARQRHRWTQLQFAQRVGVSVRTVGDWERGVKVPRNQTVIEDSLGVTLKLDGPEPDPREEEYRDLGRDRGGPLEPDEVESLIQSHRRKRPPETRAG